MKKIFITAASALLIAGCTEQRDLYDVSWPLLHIEGDWVPSLGVADMTGNATAVLYRDGLPAGKSFFTQPASATANVSHGDWEILIFNGLMFSEQNTNLTRIVYRNTDRAATFEVLSTEPAPNARLVRADGEILVDGGMAVVAAARGGIQIEAEPLFYVKYEDGRRVYFDDVEHVEAEISLTPVSLTHYAKVIVDVINPASAAVANGALRGFAASAFMSTALPSHTEGTHQLKLNNLTMYELTRGTIESPRFATFGPPLDLTAERSYTFELNTILRDGTEFSQTADVTDQVLEAIERIKQNRADGIYSPAEIIIRARVELPETEGSMVGVTPWQDDELITVKI